MRDAISPLIEWINHKATTTVIAASVAVTGKVTPEVKGLAEIPITEIFQHDLSALAWTMLIASAWIIFQLGREIVKGVIWLWRNRRYAAKV